MKKSLNFDDSPPVWGEGQKNSTFSAMGGFSEFLDILTQKNTHFTHMWVQTNFEFAKVDYMWEGFAKCLIFFFHIFSIVHSHENLTILTHGRNENNFEECFSNSSNFPILDTKVNIEIQKFSHVGDLHQKRHFFISWFYRFDP